MATAGAVARASGARIAGLSPAALAAGLGTVAFLAVAVAAAHPEASPLSPDHAGGETRWSWIFLGALAAATAVYAAGIAALSRTAGAVASVLVVTATVQLVPLVGPVLLSTDLYTYWARGRVTAVYGENPYRVAPSAYPDDPAVARMGESWRDKPTGYGPGFTLLSEGHAAAVGDSPGVAAWTYRVVAAVAVFLVAVLAARLGRDPPVAAAFIGWNPVVAVHAAGGGHNDALMMLLVVGALALSARARPNLAGACWAAAIAVKWVPVVFLPLRVLEARASGRRIAHLGLAVAAAAVAAAATWRYGTGWLSAFGTTSGQLGRITSISAPSLLERAGLGETAAIALLAACFAAGYLWLLREAWRGRARLALCAGLLLVTTSWLVPWYATWVVALAAVEDDRAGRWLALGLTAYLLRGAVPL